MQTIKQKLKKAFTITELVIVIAVIGILIAVLIPTFSNVIENARKSTALQTSNNALKEYLTIVTTDDDPTNDSPSGIVFVNNGYAHVYLNSSLHYIGKMADMPYIGTDGELKNVSDATRVGITGIGIISQKEEGDNVVAITKAVSAGVNTEQVVGFYGMQEVSADANSADAGKKAENLYFYSSAINGTNYVGYFTLESGEGLYRLESTNYSRLAGVVPATSSDNAEDNGINLEYRSQVTHIDLKQGDTVLGSELLVTRKDNQTIALTAAGDTALSAVTWTSSNTKVATVSGGTVTIVAAGTATITATSDGVSQSVIVNVSNPTATVDYDMDKFDKDYAATVYATGAAQEYDTITVTGTAPSDGTVTFTKSGDVDIDTSVAKECKITIKASAAAGAAKVNVEVNGITVRTFTLNIVAPTATVTIDDEAAYDSETKTLTVTAGTQQTFTIETTEVAPVDGVVSYAVADGATTGDGGVTVGDSSGEITVTESAVAGTAKINVMVNGYVVETIIVTVTAAGA